MIRVTASVKGDGLILGGLRGIKSADRGQLALEISRSLVGRMKHRIALGQTLTGGRMVPSKRAERDGGQTLSDKGHMLAALRAQRNGRERARINFRSLIESKKAWWLHNGTDGPYPIRRKHGKALAFESSMSHANAMLGSGRVKRADGTSYRRTTRLTQANARSDARGMAIVRGVEHPGLVPRPFFGIGVGDVEAAEKQALGFYRLASKGLTK